MAGARGILLLGDNFTAQKDYFNAKHSIQSILDNYDGNKRVSYSSSSSLDYKKPELNELQQQRARRIGRIESIYKDLENNREVLTK